MDTETALRANRRGTIRGLILITFLGFLILILPIAFKGFADEVQIKQANTEYEDYIKEVQNDLREAYIEHEDCSTDDECQKIHQHDMYGAK